jgi:hypothetical protein
VGSVIIFKHSLTVSPLQKSEPGTMTISGLGFNFILAKTMLMAQPNPHVRQRFKDCRNVTPCRRRNTLEITYFYGIPLPKVLE